MPGTFVFDALGDRDVVAFNWVDETTFSNGQVPAKRPGGRAKLTRVPSRGGENEFRVRAVDAAGNVGPSTSYKFVVVPFSAPGVAVTVGGIGLPSHIRLHSAAAGITSYGYSVDGGPETALPTGAGDVTFTSTGVKTIVAHAYAGTKLAGASTQQVTVSDSPLVASSHFNLDADPEPVSGEAGTFTFAPRRTDVAAYQYDFGDGVQQRIDADADGRATPAWTPDHGTLFTLTVRSVNADGTTSAPATWAFRVIDARPTVVSDAGANWPRTDGVGLPANVYISTELPDVTEYVYRYDGGPERSVPFDSEATVQVVPTHAGDSTFTAWARRADGSLTPATTITISISSGPTLALAAAYGSPAVAGRTGTVTFSPGLPDVVSYRYVFDGAQGEQTVDAAADGTATVPFAPGTPGWWELTVSSVSANGTVSDTRQYDLNVDDPKVSVYSAWDDWAPWGAPGEAGTFEFSGDLTAATTEYLWHVNDDPVRTAAAADNPTVVGYTPDRSGENTLYVQRRFTDGTLSAITEHPFLVG
ncbi:hypothetical protein ACIA5C_29420 [Actinoplanes sp. NPDC051343]|uniref:hypothetical protein n=1 Tax=Actinoplanes sp. NPDC051343 TaxID=3363906 RepID=UPI0037B3FB76